MPTDEVEVKVGDIVRCICTLPDCVCKFKEPSMGWVMEASSAHVKVYILGLSLDVDMPTFRVSDVEVIGHAEARAEGG